MKNYTEIKNEFNSALAEFAENTDRSLFDLDDDDKAAIFRDSISGYFCEVYGVSMAEWPANSETVGYVLLATEINGMPEHGLRILSEAGLKI